MAKASAATAATAQSAPAKAEAAKPAVDDNTITFTPKTGKAVKINGVPNVN